MKNDPSTAAAFYGMSAGSYGVDREVSRVFNEEYSTEQLRQIKSLMNLLQSRTLNLLLSGTFKTFESMSEDERQDFLYNKFANSSLAMKRKAFQALKRQICFVAYGFIPPNRETNPAWPEIGYESRDARGVPIDALPELHPLTPDKENRSFECDVCIVGSGAGGSVMAEHLSRCGWRVLVLDSGEYVQSKDFAGRQEYEMTNRLFEQRGRATTRDLSFSLLEGHVAGGSTVVNWNTSIKPPDWLREEWQSEESISNLSGKGSKEFSECIDFVWKAIKVSRDESQLNPNNEVLIRGCASLGYSMPGDYDIIDRNAVGCRERCTFCTHGCQYGCKQSTTNNLLPLAQENGAKFIFDSEVDEILVENGRASGVRANHKRSGIQYEVRSQKAVVIAAGSINTPAILLRSRLKRNVGTNLKLHPTTAISGLFDRPIKMWAGPPQSAIVTKGTNLDGKHNGFWIEAAPAHPALFASAAPWTSGENHKKLMLEMKYSSATIILVRDTGSGRVTADKRGRPVCDYVLTRKDSEHMILGMAEAARILSAAGAKRISTLHNDGFSVDGGSSGLLKNSDLDRFEEGVRSRGILPNKITLFSAHIMCSARMGREQVSFCDDNGESYELPGLFVGDACAMPTSPGMNPMITIMSLAKRNAGRIHSIISNQK